MDNIINKEDFIFYTTDEGNTNIQIIQGDETVWATQKSMSEIFDIDVSGIARHLKNIFDTRELEESSNVQKMQIANSAKPVNFYNLNVIISVGYRVNSQKATQFRIWATTILTDYMVKGFALDDARLKQGSSMFGKDYFDELLDRIREIRASERRFYQKITDLYTTAIDYDKRSSITQDFYASVQNKLHYAITSHTAAELIKERANSKKPHMGLKTWKHSGTNGKVIKGDVSVAKNYLEEYELAELNRVVTMYLDYAENMANRHKGMTMVQWISKLDDFLRFNEYGLLKGKGSMSAKIAKNLAEKEFIKFRVIQDKVFKSDFDKIAGEIRINGKIPPKKKKEPLSTFNQSLKKGLDFDPNAD